MVRKLQKREILILTLLLMLVLYIFYQEVVFNSDFDKKNDVQKSPLIKYVKNINLEGVWGRPGFEYMAMNFKKKKDNQYTVNCISGWCLGECEANRTVFYDGDTIILNRPIKEILGEEYRKLFTIEYKGEQFLLAFGYAKKFEEEVKNKDDFCENWLLRRKEKMRTRIGDPNNY